MYIYKSCIYKYVYICIYMYIYVCIYIADKAGGGALSARWPRGRIENSSPDLVIVFPDTLLNCISLVAGLVGAWSVWQDDGRDGDDPVVEVEAQWVVLWVVLESWGDGGLGWNLGSWVLPPKRDNNHGEAGWQRRTAMASPVSICLHGAFVWMYFCGVGMFVCQAICLVCRPICRVCLGDRERSIPLCGRDREGGAPECGAGVTKCMHDCMQQQQQQQQQQQFQNQSLSDRFVFNLARC